MFPRQLEQLNCYARLTLKERATQGAVAADVLEPNPLKTAERVGFSFSSSKSQAKTAKPAASKPLPGSGLQSVTVRSKVRQLDYSIQTVTNVTEAAETLI